MKKPPSAPAAAPPPAYASRYASFSNENPASPSRTPPGFATSSPQNLPNQSQRLSAGRPSLLGGVN